jgi:hypothetical protein
MTFHESYVAASRWALDLSLKLQQRIFLWRDDQRWNVSPVDPYLPRGHKLEVVSAF